MPELPEVQAHAERLTSDFGGEVLNGFRVLSFSALKTVEPSPDQAVGLSLLKFGRRGKLLLAYFGDPAGDGPAEVEASVDAVPGKSAGGEPNELADDAALSLGNSAVPPDGVHLTFVIHLMQAGRLVPDDKQSPRPRNGLARWSFESGRALLLTEAGKEHKAGIWVTTGDPLTEPPLLGLGIDAGSMTLAELRSALVERNQRLHGFLRDQKGIAGIGRMLANEVCHRAKLSPFQMTRKLTDDDCLRLYDAIRECIADALRNERSLPTMSKSADRPASVHHRKGQPCPVCGDTVRAVEYNAYEVD
ncbi:MAG TPA: DNA-formamidopyrimidine glycosylase family protein, partial [Microthrixaceae bacterium]|nr:DNA-formamidopyrimidine glycosylase family protein [Microthrixaceae bacterium]